MHSATAIHQHLDHELFWIVDETVSLLFRSGSPVSRGAMCRAVATAVGGVLIERLGDEAKKLVPAEFGDFGHDIVPSIPDHVLASGAARISRYVAEACVVYGQCRLLGMKSPYRGRPVPDDGYNPFGNEGGFGNPMKLKMLD